MLNLKVQRSKDPRNGKNVLSNWIREIGIQNPRIQAIKKQIPKLFTENYRN